MKNINLATVSDYNYLIKGLTLYRSLLENDSSFTLNYLCLDEKSFQKLESLQLPYIKPFLAEEIIKDDLVAQNLKKENTWLFCMSMASYFSRILIKEGIESIMYVDSDIYFHKSINLLEEKFKSKDIAIFRHRQFPLEIARPEGWFNVGVVFFRNSKFGKKILNWWADAVINKKYPELATCGDQKYLDRFPEMCPEDFIYVDGDVGHGAPWLWQLYDLNSYIEKGKIIYENKQQDLFFTHFSQFSMDLNKNLYVPSTMHYIYTPLVEYNLNSALHFIYQNYFEELKKTNNLYELS